MQVRKDPEGYQYGVIVATPGSWLRFGNGVTAASRGSKNSSRATPKESNTTGGKIRSS